MLQGKTVLVTGSTSRIGLGIACSLAVQGVNIIMNGFGDVEVPKAQITAAGENAIHIGYHGVDMSKSTEIEAMFACADTEFDGVGILVNNAGTQHAINAEDLPTGRWDAVITIDLTLVFHTTRFTVPGMKRKNWGRIINIASVHGLVASARKSTYVAAKHDTVGFTESMALETIQTGITFNVVRLGWVLTPLVQKQIDARAEKNGLSALEAKTDLLMGKQPSREFATPNQLSALVVFLCSDTAEQVHGAVWNMDGGWVTQ